jgi:GxxExxY protein
MQEDPRTTALVESLLQPGELNAQLSADINKLCDIIRETSFEIHKFLRNGHLEKIYENALAHRLTKTGIQVIRQHPLDVFDEDGTLLGHFSADLFIANRLVVEIKACRSLIARRATSWAIFGPHGLSMGC